MNHYTDHDVIRSWEYDEDIAQARYEDWSWHHELEIISTLELRLSRLNDAFWDTYEDEQLLTLDHASQFEYELLYTRQERLADLCQRIRDRLNPLVCRHCGEHYTAQRSCTPGQTLFEALNDDEPF